MDGKKSKTLRMTSMWIRKTQGLRYSLKRLRKDRSMAEKKYFWLKMPRNFFEKHYIKILRAKDNGDLLVMFYIWMITESIDHEGKL